ncbi:MAG: hypothetical protein ABI416_12090 [Ginsengibacter sp.]
MNSLVSNDLESWIPWKWADTLCQWLYTGNKKFTEPFFDDTVSACKSLDENRTLYKIVSDLDIMEEWANGINALTPSLVIFHVSRCGSTLLSQLLSLDENHIVLSQVPFFDELLRLPYSKQRVDVKTSDGYFNAAIKYYGQKKGGNEKYLFIKTDSWHLHFYRRLRALFPSVPVVLLYRDPLEVIQSQQRQRGIHSVPGMIEQEVFDFAKDQGHETNLDIYMANVLHGYFKIMIDIAVNDPLSLPVNYKEGIHSILKKISAFTGLDVAAEVEAFAERSRFHAKHPHQLFKEEYTELAIQDYLLPVLQLYHRLDTISLSSHLSDTST